MTTTYRDPRLGARLRLEELLDEVAREEPAREVAVRIVAARSARVAFGAVGILGAVLVTQEAISGRGSDGSGALSQLLMGTWAVALVTWLVARAVARPIARLAFAVRRPTGDLDADLAGLAARRPVPAPARLAFAGAAMPMAAVSLLAPLTIHLAFWAFFVKGPTDMLGDFDPWIVYGLALVGQAHVVLALHACRHAQRLLDAPLDAVERVGGGWQALGVTVFASAFPGVVVFGVPPLLTAVTGALFIPALFAAMRRVVATERRLLAAASA